MTVLHLLILPQHNLLSPFIPFLSSLSHLCFQGPSDVQYICVSSFLYIPEVVLFAVNFEINVSYPLFFIFPPFPSSSSSSSQNTPGDPHFPLLFVSYQHNIRAANQSVQAAGVQTIECGSLRQMSGRGARCTGSHATPGRRAGQMYVESRL